MKRLVQSIMNKLPYVRGLYRQSEAYRENMHYPPGHYYSPVPDLAEISARRDSIWKDPGPENLAGISLHTEDQLALLAQLAAYYPEMNFPPVKTDGSRYFFENNYFSYTDGFVLYAMMRHLRPRRIIEVGSGFSSALMLDINEQFLNGETRLTFIDPYTERLHSLLSGNDAGNAELIEQPVQLMDPGYFAQLESGDFLFIDSTHVVKTGGDVNFLLFEVLPQLKSGVYIHIHDIFYPFEYPMDWVYKGWNWNEVYTVRAFLMYNTSFRIILFSHYLHRYYPEVFRGMPLCYNNPGGNLWLRKT